MGALLHFQAPSDRTIISRAFPPTTLIRRAPRRGSAGDVQAPRLIRFHLDELRANFLDDGSLARLFVPTGESFRGGDVLDLLVGVTSTGIPDVPFDRNLPGPTPSGSLAAGGCLFIKGAVHPTKAHHPNDESLRGVQISLETYDNDGAIEEIYVFLESTTDTGPVKRFVDKILLTAIEHDVRVIELERLRDENIVRVAPPVSMEFPARVWSRVIGHLKYQAGLYHRPMGEAEGGSFRARHRDVNYRVTLAHNPNPATEDRVEVAFEPEDQ